MILGFPAAWVLGEYVQSIGPFGSTALLIGGSQVENTLFLQLASIIGVFGLSFLCLFINVTLYRLLVLPFSRVKTLFYYFLALFAGLYILCIWLWTVPYTTTKPIKVSLVQPNQPQLIKQNPSHWISTKSTYARLLSEAQPDSFVFFPETLLPSFILSHHPDLLYQFKRLSKERHQTVLFGSPIKNKNRYYNGLLAIDKGQLLPEHYIKSQLMPFGEYLPFRALFGRFRLARDSFPTDYYRGDGSHLFSLNGIRIGSGICLEGIFPHYFRNHALNGANFFYVGANSAWFFNSSASAKLLQMSRMRAVENRRYLLLSSNIGISAVVSPKGELLHTTPLNQEAVINTTIYPVYEKTLFTRFGPVIVFLSLLIIVLSFFKPSRYSGDL